MIKANVAVVIPLYNKEDEIIVTIQSVLLQTYQEFKIVIVDDGSTDKSLAAVETFKDPRIFILRQKNAGVSAARNTGILGAGVEWIALLDADDVWGERHLENLISARNEYPGHQVYASKITKNINEIESVFSSGEVVVDYPRYALENGWGVHSSSVLFSFSVWSKVGGFPVGEAHGEDVVTWYKMAMESPVFILDCKDVFYNHGAENNATSTVRDEDSAFVKYIDQQINNSPAAISEPGYELRNKMLLSKSFFLIADGRNKAARKYLLRARGTRRFKRVLTLCLFATCFPKGVAQLAAKRYLSKAAVNE